MIKLVYLFFIPIILMNRSFAGSIVADHTCTKIEDIPISAIEAAKSNLHIGYGFTSHGSQIVSGMSGLVSFMNSKGYPADLFQWNRSGSNGALHLYEGDGYGDGDLDHDAGYYPQWVQETRDYLGAPNADGRGSRHPEMNVIMWAWCGQLSGYGDSEVRTAYLDEMNQLEHEYPAITFVYMTGHSDGSGLEGALHKNNQQIRNYCETNGKVLFDFYDIECYDPDGHYFGDKYVSDNCAYNGGNWAQEWQNSHQVGVDWYACDAAHSEPLNANLKAYAIWWLWARLAGWDGQSEETRVDENNMSFPVCTLYQNYPNPFNSSTNIHFVLSASAPVTCSVYNLAGHPVLHFPEEFLRAGEHVFNIKLHEFPSGIYYYRVTAGRASLTGRFVLLR